MSETWAHSADTEIASQDAATAGTLLRRAREAAGLHVAALAVSLKVPVRKVEALEADRHELLTDAVFVRALASSACRVLRIDPQPVLERLPRSEVPRLVRYSDGINAPFRTPNDKAATWRQQLSRPVFLVVLAVLLGVLALFLLPRTDDWTTPVATVADASTEPMAQVVPAAPVPMPIEAEAGASLVSTTTTPEPGAPLAPAAFVPAAEGSAAALAAPAVPASGIVVFRAKGPSWVEVTDAKGVLGIRKLLTAGEAAGVSGALPLQVTIGRVDMTEVHVRGQAFDLKPVSRDNVARFEVK